MIACGASVDTDISRSNYTFLVLEQRLYNVYTQEHYPNTPQSPSVTPDYTGATTPQARAMVKDSWEYDTIQANNCKNMNSALIERFLSLMPAMAVQAYRLKDSITNAKATFIQVFN